MIAPYEPSWPLWRRRRFGDVEDRLEEYQALARYVSIDALRGFDAPEPRLSAREVPSWTYREVFMPSSWVYVSEPKRPAPLGSHATQQIRTPRDIQRYGAATCLDASLLFAALAVRAGARPHVVLSDKHALVIFGDDPASSKAAQLGIAYADSSTVELLEAGLVVAIDVVRSLTTPDRSRPGSLEEAVEAGRRFVVEAVESRASLALIDVARVNETQRLPPHAPDQDPTFIPRSLPADAGEAHLYANQAEVCARLRDETGVVVIHGDSGSGKTTAALHLAAGREVGPSLVLDATSGETVIVSAGEIAARERGASFESLASQDRDGDAAALLTRLGTAPTPWCVVFDNADGDPSQVLPRLPRADPDRGQVVLVTTTNPTWLQLGLVSAFETLSPVGDADVEQALGEHRELTSLVRGRAVTLRAFLRYLEAGGDADSLHRHASALRDDELRGPSALVSAVLERHPELRGAIRRVTLLPPDHVPIGDGVSDSESLQWLGSLGVLSITAGASVARMHRLLGRAAESVLGGDDEARTAADLLSDESSFDALSTAADPELLGRYTRLILSRLSPDEPVPRSEGFILQRAASLMELRGRIVESRSLAAPAVEALGAVRGEEPVELADALQSLARWANQHATRDRAALDLALEQMEWAQEVAERFGDERRAARSRRLEGLLRLKVGALNPDREAGTQEIVSALADLENEAALAEREGSGVDRAEALRARFNVAGPRVSLAQRSPWQADDYLREAERVYSLVGAGRRTLYPQTQHPHVAACVTGQALVRYMRANLVEVSYDGRQRLLREATDLETEALADRFELEGPLGGPDTSKSSRLLTKIAFARHRLSDGLVSSAVLEEARREIGVPRLTAETTDPRAHADRWLSSPPLASVLGLFGVDSPGALESTAMARDVFDDFEARTILSAARALGLMDTELPTRRIFDKLLVCGDHEETGVKLVEGLLSRGEVSGASVRSLDGEGSVLVVAPHPSRVRLLAVTQRRMVGAPIDALGFEPTPGRATFKPHDYLREIARTAEVLRETLAS